MTISSDAALYRAKVFRWATEVGLSQVRLVIYQPKADGVTERVMSMAELEQFAAELEAKAHRVVEADRAHAAMPMAQWWPIHLNPQPNDTDCAWCRAMPVCPSVQAKLQADTGMDFTAMPEESALVETVAAYAPLELATFMNAVPLLESALKAVRAETERRLMSGVPVDGWGLELGRQGNREFKDAEEAERLLRKQFRLNIEDVYTLKLKSPTQIEKLTKPAKDAEGVVQAPILGARRWATLESQITRSDAKPSVKPLSAIKNPWIPPKISADEFKSVDDASDLA